MAKKQRKVRVDGDSVIGSQGAENLGLKEPFPASPGRPGKYCLYVNKNDGLMVVIYASAYAARKFLDILLGDDTVSRIKGITGEDDTIVTDTNIRVRCSHIAELLDYTYNDREEEWELGEPDSTKAMTFRHGQHIKGEEKAETVSPTGERVVKVKKEPRPSKDGLVTIQQIAADMKMEPRECRGILRKMKVQKQPAGWAWAKNEVDAIKEILHNNK